MYNRIYRKILQSYRSVGEINAPNATRMTIAPFLVGLYEFIRSSSNTF